MRPRGALPPAMLPREPPEPVGGGAHTREWQAKTVSDTLTSPIVATTRTLAQRCGSLVGMNGISVVSRENVGGDGGAAQILLGQVPATAVGAPVGPLGPAHVLDGALQLAPLELTKSVDGLVAGLVGALGAHIYILTDLDSEVNVTFVTLTGLDQRSRVTYMSRYKVTSAWTPDSLFGNFLVQEADITDTLNGNVYTYGAKRVVDTRTGKPAKIGKGGTVPFYGECAWMDAERLAQDLAMKEAYGR